MSALHLGAFFILIFTFLRVSKVLQVKNRREKSFLIVEETITPKLQVLQCVVASFSTYGVPVCLMPAPTGILWQSVQKYSCEAVFEFKLCEIYSGFFQIVF